MSVASIVVIVIVAVVVVVAVAIVAAVVVVAVVGSQRTVRGGAVRGTVEVSNEVC